MGVGALLEHPRFDLTAHIKKASVTAVDIEAAGTAVIADRDIQASVAVEVTKRRAVSFGGGIHSGGGRYVVKLNMADRDRRPEAGHETDTEQPSQPKESREGINPTGKSIRMHDVDTFRTCPCMVEPTSDTCVKAHTDKKDSRIERGRRLTR